MVVSGGAHSHAKAHRPHEGRESALDFVRVGLPYVSRHCHPSSVLSYIGQRVFIQTVTPAAPLSPQRFSRGTVWGLRSEDLRGGLYAISICIAASFRTRKGLFERLKADCDMSGDGHRDRKRRRWTRGRGKQSGIYTYLSEAPALSSTRQALRSITSTSFSSPSSTTSLSSSPPPAPPPALADRHSALQNPYPASAWMICSPAEFNTCHLSSPPSPFPARRWAHSMAMANRKTCNPIAKGTIASSGRFHTLTPPPSPSKPHMHT